MELYTLAANLVWGLPMVLCIYYKDRAVVVLAAGIQSILKATFQCKVL